MRLRRRSLALFSTMGVVLAGCLATRAQEQPQVVPPAPAWDDPAAAKFAARGVAVPKTVMPAETSHPLDLAWIRAAFGYAEPLNEEDVARLSGGGGGEQPNGAAEMQSREAPGGAAPEESDMNARGAPRPAPSPAPTTAGPPRDAAPQRGDADEADSLAEEGEPAAQQKAGAGEDADVPQPVLSRLETTARLGKVLFQNAQGGYDALEPRGLRVVTFIDGPRARTVVDLVFRNPHDQRLEGTFYYPLPDGATPAGFGMFPGTRRVDDPKLFGTAPLLPPLTGGVDAALGAVAPQRATNDASVLVQDWQAMQVARVVEQKKAREVYEQVVRERVDPALMEWSGANTFKARVFPLEPRSLKRVVFAYEQTLPRDGDLLRWTFPLSGERTLGGVEAIVHLRPGVDLVAGVTDDPTSLRTPKGPVEEVDGWRRLRLAADEGFAGAFDLALRAQDPRRQVIAGPVPDLGGRAFFARVVPEVPTVVSDAPTGRALFVVDTSLSEEGLRRSLAGQLLLKALENDPTIFEYAVLLFDVRARWLHQVGWRKNTPEARLETADELTKVYLEGATNLSAALEELERQAAWIDGDAPATRFLLSDGLITWGLDRVDGLLARHPTALRGRWLSYRFGDAPVNRDLYDALSRETAGRTVSVLTADQLNAAAVAHRSAPVLLRGVRVTGAAAVDLVVAGDPRLVFPGQELEVAGRLPAGGEGATLEVTLEIDGKPIKTEVALPPASADAALGPRAWAELWTRRLLALDDERLQRMVVALSQTFTLANEAASLLILETEADYERFDVKKEQVDLTDLERLRAAEEDQRRDRLQGIALDDVSREGRDLVRLLSAHTGAATQPALPLLDRPLAGGDERLAAEVDYRAARAKDPMNVRAYDQVARARAVSGDTFGAIRALSCLVEQHPREGEANRLVGYACLALGQYAPAAELFERVRLNRPFEPQSYLEEGLALEALGRWGEAARNYEICIGRAFPRHDAECKVVASYHYARLLAGRLREGGLDAPAKAQVEARLAALRKSLSGDELARRALQLTIHWNTDSTDIDLWVVEPEGEKCFYGHRETGAGGKLFWDTTTGYGPELYQRAQGGKGVFDVLIHYYGNNSARLSVPTSVLLVRDRDCFGPEDGYTRRFQMRLLPDSQAVLRLRQETF
jgi:tetratricopeptide (TPR) repeat protein